MINRIIKFFLEQKTGNRTGAAGVGCRWNNYCAIRLARTISAAQPCTR